MDVRIGIQNVARELAFESDESREDVAKAVEQAIAGGSLLRLKDSKGGEIVVPAAGLAYVEFGREKPRRVGFAAE
ncbi:MAG: DUF3107 domain-containing protein [Galactobacter sp.]|uniref:DUF3107 domain-containing protein n=1 Tax=Galactobacter sp. TaxID=2676125 RepID=UPI0025B907FE|nr:DUF3107 domain-containing protein [Galactobacter sp.]